MLVARCLEMKSFVKSFVGRIMDGGGDLLIEGCSGLLQCKWYTHGRHGS